jgi:hypothetical protein
MQNRAAAGCACEAIYCQGHSRGEHPSSPGTKAGIYPPLLFALWALNVEVFSWRVSVSGIIILSKIHIHTHTHTHTHTHIHTHTHTHTHVHIYIVEEHFLRLSNQAYTLMYYIYLASTTASFPRCTRRDWSWYRRNTRGTVWRRDGSVGGWRRQWSGCKSCWRRQWRRGSTSPVVGSDFLAGRMRGCCE